MYSNQLKRIAQRLYDVFSYTYRAIANVLNIGKSTIQRWLSEESNKKLIVNRKRGRPPILIDISLLLPECKFMSLKQMIVQKSLKMSSSTLWRRMKENDISNKRIYHCQNNNQKDLQQLRKDFSKRMESVDVDNLISIDETSFYIKLNPLTAWSRHYERVHLPMQRILSKRYTVITAITSSNILHQEIHEQSINSTLFMSFIEKLPFTNRTQVLLDNAAFHKSKIVLDALHKKSLSPVFTSPYSPEWNPVEFYFGYIKAKYRRNSMVNVNFEEMKNSIVNINSMLTESYYTSLFQKVIENIKCNHHR